MAKIHPFKAIRPTRDKVHLVATRPYYTYKKKVLHAKLQDNPLWTCEAFTRGQAWVDLILLANHSYGYFYKLLTQRRR